MEKVFNAREFHEEVVRCSKCGWEGSGSDVNIIDFYGLAKVKEVHCPRCDTYLGGIRNVENRREERNARYYGGDPLSNQFG